MAGASAKCRASARRGEPIVGDGQLDDGHMMDEAAMSQAAHFDSLVCGSGHRLPGRQHCHHFLQRSDLEGPDETKCLHPAPLRLANPSAFTGQ